MGVWTTENECCFGASDWQSCICFYHSTPRRVVVPFKQRNGPCWWSKVERISLKFCFLSPSSSQLREYKIQSNFSRCMPFEGVLSVTFKLYSKRYRYGSKRSDYTDIYPITENRLVAVNWQWSLEFIFDESGAVRNCYTAEYDSTRDEIRLQEHHFNKRLHHCLKKCNFFTYKIFTSYLARNDYSSLFKL